MKDKEKNKSENSSRRSFLKKMGAGVGAVSLAGLTGGAILKDGEVKAKSGKKVKLLSPDGKLVEVDQADIKPAKKLLEESKEEARLGLPDRKFCMVIDLAKCANACCSMPGRSYVTQRS
jgi:hypothetical protein